MKYFSQPLALVAILFAAFVSADDVVLYEDGNIPSPQTQLNGMAITNVNSGPAVDANHPTAGEVNLATAGAFSGFQNAVAVPTVANATGYTFSVDVYIPTGTTLRNGPADTLYLQWGSDVNGNFASGAFGNTTGLPFDEWFTMTSSITPAQIPGGSTTLTTFFINGNFQDFSTPNGTDGVAFYVDNAVLTAQVIPEPSMMLVFGATGLCGLMRRRR